MGTGIKRQTSWPLLIYGLRTATEAAARAAYDWIGRGEKHRGDVVAAEAMRVQLSKLPIDGVVVVGEGDKGISPGFYNGEQLGDPRHRTKFDIAIDPLEGTSYVAKGMTNAMSVIAMAPRGSMFDPGPAFYMEKFVAPPAARGKIDPTAPVADKLETLSRVLGKPVSEITVFVLEKPRHRRLVKRIHAAGARVALYPAGDVAGALMAAIPDSGIDALMGTGGTLEGIISASAVRALGGEFLGRLDPQLATEKAEVRKIGMDTETWHPVEDLVRSDEVYFCATGITTGLLFEGVERTKHHERVQSLFIAGTSGERQVLTTFHRRGDLA